MITPPRNARLYFRPTGFIDAPFGYDGQFARLAGGMQFFSAYEIIAVDQGVRAGQWLVPVSAIDEALAVLTDEQQAAARKTLHGIAAPRPALKLGDRTVPLNQSQVMGILNMTPDSFSGGSEVLDDPGAAAALAVDMAGQGAAIIDIGGESTRPGAPVVWEEDEKARVIPLLDVLRPSGLALSLDTRKASVMQAGLASGVHMINDVSALLYDDRALDVMVAASCPVVLMHFPGSPVEPHKHGGYTDPLIEVYDWLEDRVDAVVAAGIARDRIIADPGIGFGKGVAANLAILNGLALLHGLGVPILLGASRKRMIGALANEAPAGQRLGGSLALALKGAEQGAQLIRVHDVADTVQALKIWRGLRDAALSPGERIMM